MPADRKTKAAAQPLSGGTGSYRPGPDDIIRALFRHRWIIVLCTLLSLSAAVAMSITRQRNYISSAKLLVRFVVQSVGVPSISDGSVATAPDSRGQNILTTESHIIYNRELAREVATNVGPARILAPFGGGADHHLAAEALLGGLDVEVPRLSNVLGVMLTHPDPAVAQESLAHWIDAYRRRHLSLHRGLEMSTFLMEQTDSLKTELQRYEEGLRNIKATNSIVSIASEKAAIIEQKKLLQQALLNAESERALREARVTVLSNLLTSARAATNAGLTLHSNRGSLFLSSRAETLRETLRELRRQQLEYERQFTAESPLVRQIREEIDAAEQSLAAMGAADDLVAPVSPRDGERERQQPFNFNWELAELMAVNSKIPTIQTQLVHLDRKILDLDRIERISAELEREKEITAENYKYFRTSQEQMNLDKQLDSSKTAGIGVIQHPTVGRPDDVGWYKVALLLAMMGPCLGVALALIKELVWDGSVKSQRELIGRFGLPVVNQIPLIAGPGPGSMVGALPFRAIGRGLSRAMGRMRRRSGSGIDEMNILSQEIDVTSLPAFHGQVDIVRDRILSRSRLPTDRSFVLGVIPIGRASGGSSVAAALAASLSYERDKGTLLIQVDHGQFQFEQFLSGQGSEVEERALAVGGLGDSAVPIPSAAINGRDFSALVIQQLRRLAPKIRQEEWSFVVLDLPPLPESSLIPRVAPFLDQALLVVEPLKTPRVALAESLRILGKPHQVPVCVMNKSRRVVPSWFPIHA